jgi:hypothetical protein
VPKTAAEAFARWRELTKPREVKVTDDGRIVGSGIQVPDADGGAGVGQ